MAIGTVDQTISFWFNGDWWNQTIGCRSIPHEAV